MITIGIDINGVLRNFLMNFCKYYKQGFDHTFDYDEFEMWSEDPQALFQFGTKQKFEKFTYEDFAYELYGAAPTCDKQLSGIFNDWVTLTLPDLDIDEEVKVVMVSPFEYGLSIPSTLFFLSKIGCRAREVLMPIDSQEIWDKCDIVVTASPRLLSMKPEGKVSIKIEQEYNKEGEADFTYSSLKTFCSEDEHIQEAITKLRSC